MTESTPPTSGSSPFTPLNQPQPDAPVFPQGGGQFQPGGGWDSFEKWLGPEGFKKFQNNLCQAISEQMAKDKAKEHEAAEELKKAETGEDD